MPRRLTVEKAKWRGNAQSPVMLSVDDLTNAWHAPPGASRWQTGGDWGGGRSEQASALRYLEERLFDDFPEVRATFFTVAGPISSYTYGQPFAYSASLDASPESAAFFRSLADDPRFELAYHGFNHGTPGRRTEDFRQEWAGFGSVAEAVEQTRRGIEIFRRATGGVPRGGKYGGWEYNEYSERAIAECGFVWWCRDWMPRDVSGAIPDSYYEPQFFGEHLVIALPTTVHGRFWDRHQIDRLLGCRQIIAIEEHIAPVRPDGLVQTPNVVDDIEDLRRLYAYLRGKSVWHATGSEIAEYVDARERSVIFDITNDAFSLRYEGSMQAPSLTLLLGCSSVCSDAEPLIELCLPDGSVVCDDALHFDVRHFRHVATVPAVSGRYRVRPRKR